MSKPFELFNPEDFKFHCGIEHIAQIANAILNERGKRVYCQTHGFNLNLPDRKWFPKIEIVHGALRGEALLINARPIEEEKDCNHNWGPDYAWIKTDEIFKSFDYCPKCGKELTN